MSFTLKKEIGISDLFSLVAVIISAAAFWQSYKSNDAFIVKGTQKTLVHPYKDSKCNMLVSIPVSYHNSGKRAVPLNRFVPADVPKAIFLKNRNIVEEVDVDYRFYILEGNLVNPNEILTLLNKTNEYPLESFKHFGALIKPNEVYEASIVIHAQDHANGERIFDDVMVAVDVEFGNGQIIEHRAGIDLKTNIPHICSN